MTTQFCKMNRVILIAGPTASGKSGWALSLAKKYDGEIINADAIQVYQDLQIISARPSPTDMAKVRHHLYGYIDGSIRYSVGQWLRDVVPVIVDVLARGKTPILVGGTGLYFKALTEGLADIPDQSPEAIQTAQRLYESEGIEALWARARGLDEVATSRVSKQDPQRLLRIVSVALGTEKTLSQWQEQTRPSIPKGAWAGAVLMPDRAQLYQQINRRFAEMITAGGLAEIKALYGRVVDEADFTSDLPVMKAIGVSQYQDYLNEDQPVAHAGAVALAQRDTRRFAKRQYTWFRGQMLTGSQHWQPIGSQQDAARFETQFSPVSFSV